MDSIIIIYCVIIFVLLLFSAFFSASETALTAVSRARIYQLVMSGNKRAMLASRLRKDKEAMISAILLGNSAVNTAASAIATTLSVKLFGDSGGLVVVTVVMTLLVVIFSEVLPKTYAIQNSEKVSLAFAYPLNLVMKLFFPITYTIQIINQFLLKMFKIAQSENNLISATDVIRGTIELHHHEGAMIKQDRDMLGSILDLNDIEVRDIMEHRTEVETLDCKLSAEEMLAMAVKNMHSRLPVWVGDPDNIIGLLHVKDLIKIMQERPNISQDEIIAICHEPWFIPETTNLRDQLLAFRSKRQHFAFVVDEYGDWQGIVTLEDIIEEIVGNIDDEHDDVNHSIQKLGENTYLVNGGAHIRDINRYFSWNLPDEGVSTMAGLVIHAAGEIPEIGNSFGVHGLECTIIEKSATQITKIKIEKSISLEKKDDFEI